jgi:hypothetical protein
MLTDPPGGHRSDGCTELMMNHAITLARLAVVVAAARQVAA